MTDTPAPMTDKESYTMQKIFEWWSRVCEHEGMDPPIDMYRACLEAAFSHMIECETKARMPVSPTRIQ